MELNIVYLFFKRVWEFIKQGVDKKNKYMLVYSSPFIGMSVPPIIWEGCLGGNGMKWPFPCTHFIIFY